jgi:hypothetical protein
MRSEANEIRHNVCFLSLQMMPVGNVCAVSKSGMCLTSARQRLMYLHVPASHADRMPNQKHAYKALLNDTC